MKKLLYCMQHHSRQETLIYGAMWALLFVAPMLSLYVRTVNDTQLTFDWHEVFIVWRQYAVFLLLFLLHNYLLAPLLVYRQKKVLYFSAVACMMGSLYSISATVILWIWGSDTPTRSSKGR